jgi:hypothetical protein
MQAAVSNQPGRIEKYIPGRGDRSHGVEAEPLPGVGDGGRGALLAPGATREVVRSRPDLVGEQDRRALSLRFRLDLRERSYDACGAPLPSLRDWSGHGDTAE